MKTLIHPLRQPRIHRVTSYLVVSLLAFIATAPAEETSAKNEITLPVRVFRMKSDVSEKINCRLSDQDIKALFEIVNENWAQADIRWQVESLRDLPVASSLAKEFDTGVKGGVKNAPLKTLTKTYRQEDLLNPGFNVFIVESLGKGLGGVFRPVPFGDVIYARVSPRGMPVPAILAHELGHSLGLPHTVFEKNNNLMMGSSPGRVPARVKPLTASQIKLARAQAATGKPFKPTRRTAPAAPDKLFALLDVDGDGKMTVAENQEPHRAFVQDTLRKASRAPDQSLSRDEYDLMKLSQTRTKRSGDKGKRAAPPISQLFKQFDQDQDKRLTSAELPAGLRSRVVRWDTDKDGFVTAEELHAYRKRFGINAEGFRK
jgi:Ca2+-binding EF-hand superfamily protein